MIEIGQKYRKYDRETLHIRGFVDNQVIYRVWNRYDRVWHYEAVSQALFLWLIDCTYIRLMKE